MGLKRAKRKIAWDDNALAPLIWVGILAVTTVVGLGAYGIYTLGETGDVTYNVTDPGPLSAFGVDLGTDTLLLIVAGVVVLFLIMGRRGK